MISLTTKQLKEIIDLEFAIRDDEVNDEFYIEEKLDELWHYQVLDSFADDIGVDIDDLYVPVTEIDESDESLMIKGMSNGGAHDAEIIAYLVGIIEQIPEYTVEQGPQPRIIFVKKA